MKSATSYQTKSLLWGKTKWLQQGAIIPFEAEESVRIMPFVERQEALVPIGIFRPSGLKSEEADISFFIDKRHQCCRCLLSFDFFLSLAFSSLFSRSVLLFLLFSCFVKRLVHPKKHFKNLTEDLAARQ